GPGGPATAAAGDAVRAAARTARRIPSATRLARRDRARERVGGRRFHSHADQVAGARRAGEDDRLHLAALSRHPPLGAPGRPLDQHLDLGADETTVDLGRDGLLHVDQATEAPRLLVVGNRIAPAERARALARRVLEEEGRVVAHAAHERLRGGEVRLVLAGEADDDVGRERDPRYARAQPGDQRLVFRSAIFALHERAPAARARLDREGQLGRDGGAVGQGIDQALAQVGRTP